MSYDFSDLAVVMVEDNPHLRKLMKEILIGYNIRNVKAFGQAEDMREELLTRPYDLAIIDWNMKPISGIELVYWIRNNKNSPDKFLPIIMVSGHSERHRVEKARDAGVNEFIVKPLSGSSIYNKLVQLTDNPRPFVDTKHYFGPDRRRKNQAELAKQARRNEDPKPE